MNPFNVPERGKFFLFVFIFHPHILSLSLAALEFLKYENLRKCKNANIVRHAKRDNTVLRSWEWLLVSETYMILFFCKIFKFYSQPTTLALFFWYKNTHPIKSDTHAWCFSCHFVTHLGHSTTHIASHRNRTHLSRRFRLIFRDICSRWGKGAEK